MVHITQSYVSYISYQLQNIFNMHILISQYKLEMAYLYTWPTSDYIAAGTITTTLRTSASKLYFLSLPFGVAKGNVWKVAVGDSKIWTIKWLTLVYKHGFHVHVYTKNLEYTCPLTKSTRVRQPRMRIWSCRVCSRRVRTIVSKLLANSGLKQWKALTIIPKRAW